MLYRHLLILIGWVHGRRVISRRVVSTVETVRAHAMKLQPDAGRAWPSIRRRGIAFDLSSPATLASSHNFQPLVAVVLVYKDIVCTQMLGCSMHAIASFKSRIATHSFESRAAYTAEAQTKRNSSGSFVVECGGRRGRCRTWQRARF